MWNVPIFKKLAQLFLKHYVGQQNNCGLPVCYFCLKATSLFSHCFLLPFLCKHTSWHRHWELSHIEVSTPVIPGMSLTFGALLPSPPARALALSPCLGLSYGTVFPPSRLAPPLCGQRQPSQPFFLFYLTSPTVTSVTVHVTSVTPCCLAHLGVIGFRWESTQPRSWALNVLVWPLVNGKQVCHLKRCGSVPVLWMGSPWELVRQLGQTKKLLPLASPMTLVWGQGRWISSQEKMNPHILRRPSIPGFSLLVFQPRPISFLTHWVSFQK